MMAPNRRYELSTEFRTPSALRRRDKILALQPGASVSAAAQRAGGAGRRSHLFFCAPSRGAAGTECV